MRAPGSAAAAGGQGTPDAPPVRDAPPDALSGEGPPATEQDGGAAASTRLLAAIAAMPEAFDFFQALRRIEATHPDRPKLGESARPAADPIRIGQEAALAFAPRPIAGLTHPEQGAPLLLTYFFGLFGPNGAMPLHVTEKAFSRQHNNSDPALARFADLFHHRMASLFYRAWAESEPTASHDRPESDRFGTQLAALAGFGMASLRGRDAMPDLAKLHFAGRLGSHTRNPDGLRAIVAGFFQAPVEVIEFVPRWISLPGASLCHLGRSRETGTLGQTATVGRRLRVHGHDFRLRLGPLGLAQYERMLPGGEGLARLVPLVRNYIGDELGWELNLVLREAEVPAVCLGRSGRLGWTGWLGRRPGRGPADDLRLQPVAGATTRGTGGRAL